MVVAVSHGAVVRAWCAARVGNLAPGYAEATPLGNTGVVVLEGAPDDGWRAVSWEGRSVEGPAAHRPEHGPASRPVPHEG